MYQQTIRIAVAVAVVVTAVGVAVFCGWAFDVEALKTIYGPITMKTNAAIAFVCCGVSLWLRARRRVWILAVVAAAGGAALGAMTLSQHVFGWDLGIDQRLFTEPPGAPATASPNRMGPHASTSFMLAGAALLLLWRSSERSFRVAQMFASAGAAFALVAVTGYGYGATELYGIARYTGIALHTAVTLLALHLGILAVSAERGPTATFVDEGAAGIVLRRLTIPVLMLPLLVGYLYMQGREAEIVDYGLGASLFAVAMMIVLLAGLWRTAVTIQVADSERRRAYEAAKQANQLKDQFIAVLSHELRTPLNVMLGRLQLLEGDVDPETRVRAATVIARNGQLLARLVEDLLDLSRATAGQFELSRGPVDINALVHATIESLSAQASKNDVRIAADLSPAAGTITADAQRMQQVLGNLLSNAIKFTPVGGLITVKTARDAGLVTVTVTDTGIGFDDEFARRLFEPFHQADQSTRREHGGLGLGLSIARHLVALHGGRITGWSAGAGRGATFTVELPVEPLAELASASQRSDRGTHAGTGRAAAAAVR